MMRIEAWHKRSNADFLGITPSTSHRVLAIDTFLTDRNMRSRAQVAQSVEQGTENPCVVGSIPTLGTISHPKMSDKVLKTHEMLGA
jgi:hypothetical protein